ncbi:MAG: Lrp/AsnC family transcriptional regulator [Maricaulis sp.]|jgi:Lrp/AsnC family leucine-responsive transcriptional regulator|nr:Lrp/AsnC family transcriptional regulator [Maricaulis sp.]MDG2045180.1 Lrp/AsnC family transcriptional regulator [Maricaulis sp.]
MDTKDQQIIRALQQNARMTNQELAAAVNLSPSPCLRRVRLLEKAGAIRGYAAIVDQKIVGYPLTVFMRIRLQQHSADIVMAFEDRIARLDEVMECYLITGEADYSLRILARSLEDYERFVRDEIHAIPGIASMDTSFAYSMIKQRFVFPD